MDEDVLQFRRRILPADHPAIATAMGSLAESYRALGRLKEAAAKQEEVLELTQRNLAPKHPSIDMEGGTTAATSRAPAQCQDHEQPGCVVR